MESLIDRAARDLINSKHAIALTGAGIQTESGIANFRGPSGIWAKNPEAERRAYQTYGKFLANPKEYQEERLTAPSLLGDLTKVEPNPGHHALAELENMGILKCVITQNIDNLHRRAGSMNVLEYHGNAFRLRCASCNTRFDLEEYDMEKLREEGIMPPLCRDCGGTIKADVVHFQDTITSDVAHQSLEEAWKCDLILICGTSAAVYPFATLPRIARERIFEKKRTTKASLCVVEKTPAAIIVEVNADTTPLTYEQISDYLIQRRTGEILPKIAERVNKRFQPPTT